MREIPLSQGKVATVDDDDFAYLSRFSWHTAANKKTFYAQRKPSAPLGETGPIIKMHRVIMAAPPGLEIDHINGNGLDNRKENLRIVTTRENSQNRHIQKTSLYPGVYWDSERGIWRARIRVGQGRIHLGRFKTEIAAANAYNSAYESLKTNNWTGLPLEAPRLTRFKPPAPVHLPAVSDSLLLACRPVGGDL